MENAYVIILVCLFLKRTKLAKTFLANFLWLGCMLAYGPACTWLFNEGLGWERSGVTRKMKGD